MGIFDGMLLVCDIDGTLIDRERRISEETLRAVAQFRAEGGAVTLASGRSVRSIAPYWEQLGCTLPVICANGAAVYDFARDAFLWECPLPPRVTELLDGVCDNLPEVGIAIYKGADVYFCRMNEICERNIRHEGLPRLMAEYRDLPSPWFKILFEQQPEVLPATRDYLLQSRWATEFRMFQSASVYFEVMHKDASKGAALTALCEHVGIDMAHCIAVGDNANDVAMLRTARYGFAVGNATPDAAAAAPYHCADHNNSAVADVIAQMTSICAAQTHSACAQMRSACV